MTETETTPTSPNQPVTVDAESFIRAVTNVAMFAATDSTVPALCTVHMTATDGMLTLIATDRYAAAQEQLPCKTGNLTCLADVKPLVQAVKALGQILKSQARFTAHLADKPAIIITAPAEGTSFATFTLTRYTGPDTSLTAATTQADGFPTRSARSLITDAADSDENDWDRNIMFNAAYLAKLAKVNSGERQTMIRMHYRNGLKPMRATIGDTFTAIIMPVQSPSA